MIDVVGIYKLYTCFRSGKVRRIQRKPRVHMYDVNLVFADELDQPFRVLTELVERRVKREMETGAYMCVIQQPGRFVIRDAKPKPVAVSQRFPIGGDMLFQPAGGELIA